MSVPAVNHMHVMLCGFNLLGSWIMLRMSWIVNTSVLVLEDVNTTPGSLMRMRMPSTFVSSTLAVLL